MTFQNPFTPGAGHPPPYLAGRETEKEEFTRLLAQATILDNMVLTGLRGIGKTVLLDQFRPLATSSGWLWVGSDLSEASSVDEERLATRLLTDLAVATSGIEVTSGRSEIGFGKTSAGLRYERLDYLSLRAVYDQTPGLVSDKLKRVFDVVWEVISTLDQPIPGIVFAYDEAQNMSDHPQKQQYPLALLLDIFQSIQRRGIRFLLVLAGLPTLFSKLVDARTFAERMFRVVFLKRLDEHHSKEAILRPIAVKQCPVRIDDSSVRAIIGNAGGYPYFIQFICREVYDAFLSNFQRTKRYGSVPLDEITRKLDADFFAGRWNRVTDRQRDLLHIIAALESSDDEFTVAEIVERSHTLGEKPFSSSHVNQMLVALVGSGLVYKNRHGRYSFAVPLFGSFVLRQMSPAA
jgi:AAA ATPase-like protein